MWLVLMFVLYLTMQKTGQKSDDTNMATNYYNVCVNLKCLTRDLIVHFTTHIKRINVKKKRCNLGMKGSDEQNCVD